MVEHPSAVVARLEEEIRRAGSQKEWANAHDLSAQFVNDVLNGRRDVTDRLASALGYQRITLWKDTRNTGENNAQV